MKASSILAVSLDVVLGTLGGIACGYIAQWVYAKLFAQDSVDIGSLGTMGGNSGTLNKAGVAAYNSWKDLQTAAGADKSVAKFLSVGNNAALYAGTPSYSSIGNPVFGILLLQMINVAIIMLYYMAVGRYAAARSSLGQTMFVMSMFILELDDMLAFSQRIVAPFGGDPLRYGAPITDAQMQASNAASLGAGRSY